MAIPWIVDGEPVVGQNHPTLADVDNRPLKYVITQSGLDSAAAFGGFIAISPPAAQIGDIHIVGKIKINDAVVITDAVPVGFETTYLNTTVAGNKSLCGFVFVQSVATTGAVEVTYSSALASHTSGTIPSLVGLNGVTSTIGAGGTTTLASGLRGEGILTAGNVTRFSAVLGTCLANGATITTAALFLGAAYILSSGSITNAYGMLIEDITVGSTINRAIKTGVGIVEFGDKLMFSPAVSKIIPGTTSIALRNNVDNASNLLIVDAGDATFRATVTATRFIGGIDATAGILTIQGAYANATVVIKGAGTGTNATMSIVDSANGNLLSVSDNGLLQIKTPPGFAAGDKYLIIDATGKVHISALGPAS